MLRERPPDRLRSRKRSAGNVEHVDHSPAQPTRSTTEMRCQTGFGWAADGSSSAASAEHIGSCYQAVLPRRLGGPSGEVSLPELRVLVLQTATTPEEDFSRLERHLGVLRGKWSQMRLKKDEHPIPHVLLDGLRKWKADQTFELQPKTFLKVVVAIRMTPEMLYCLGALGEYEGGAYLLALWTCEKFRQRGLGREALSTLTDYLSKQGLSASLPLQSCVNKAFRQPFYRRLLEETGWGVGALPGFQEAHDTLSADFPPLPQSRPRRR